jgi:hypothetical protein
MGSNEIFLNNENFMRYSIGMRVVDGKLILSFSWPNENFNLAGALDSVKVRKRARSRQHPKMPVKKLKFFYSLPIAK